MGGNGGRVGIELQVERCDGFVVGFADDGVNGRERETLNDGINGGRHVGCFCGRARPVLSPSVDGWRDRV